MGPGPHLAAAGRARDGGRGSARGDDGGDRGRGAAAPRAGRGGDPMRGRDFATGLATRLAAVPERAMDALPNLPVPPWRRRRASVPAGLAVFGLGLVLGVGIGLLLYAGALAEADSGAPARTDGGAADEPHPGGNPIQ